MNTVTASPTSLDVPAWIQATTAIAAIFVAYWVAQRDGVEHRRDLFAKRIQFALFSVEVIERAFWSLHAVSDEVNEIVQGRRKTTDEPLVTLSGAVARVRKEFIPIERLRDLPTDQWPDAEMATIFKLDYERMIEVRRQSLPFGRPDHLTNYPDAEAMLADYNNQFGELAELFTGYFRRYVLHVKAFLDSPRAARLPRRYLQRVGAENQEVVNLVLLEIEQAAARKAAA